MTNLGLPQFITTNEEEFVDRASSLASDIESLAAIRAGMRDRMRASALMNGPQLARHFESLLREAVNSMAETA
jgi:predicted O-linked N-acetylglucosamine transferase (SPINDLY family)